MKIQLYIDGKLTSVYNAVDLDERLDEQFDTGSIQVINDAEDPFPDYCAVRVRLYDDDLLTNKNLYFYGFDTVEKRGANYYVHNLELVEPTRLLMGIFICGRKVTQPIDGEKKTLYRVCTQLLNTITLLETGTDPELTIEDDPVLDTISPEFHWEEGTTLWECLCDIASVVDCIPRLTTKQATVKAFTHIVFDKINEETGVYQM